MSTERNTGKTNFLNFLKALFGDNMTINRNEDFRSNFNSEWASKLIIGVYETLHDRKEDSERIKSYYLLKKYIKLILVAIIRKFNHISFA